MGRDGDPRLLTRSLRGFPPDTCSGVMSGQLKCAPCWAFPSAADASPTTRAKSGSDPSGRFDQGNLVVGEAVELIDARIYLLVNGIYLTPDEALFRLQLGRGKLPMQGEH